MGIKFEPAKEPTFQERIKHFDEAEIIQYLLDFAASQQMFDIPADALKRLQEQMETGNVSDGSLRLKALISEIETMLSGGGIERFLIVLLWFIENHNVQTRRAMLHKEIKRRRELPKRFEMELDEAVKRQDAKTFLSTQEDENILLEEMPRSPTRQIDPETVELAIEALRLKTKNPQKYCNYQVISTEIFGEISHAEKIKKAVYRAREAMKI